MVVPLREHRHLGIERAQIRIEQIVFVVAAEIGERPRNLRLLLCDDVLPYLSIRKSPLRWNRAIGIDVITAMDEEVGPTLQHGGVGAHSATRFVDAPTAAGGVARPDERYAAPFPRRRAKAPDLRLAQDG
jgi:hypothetical protein